MTRPCVRLGPLALVVSLTACGAAGSSRALVDLDTQVHAVQAEQSRQAHRIELLENRVVLAEDSARLARQALVGVGPHRSISIADEQTPADEPIASSAPTASEPDEPPASDEARPMLRAQGRERLPVDASVPPIVVHDDDRLPVAPVPGNPSSQLPASTPSRGPMPLQGDAPGRSALPASVSPETSAPHPGVSSARDARATAAYEQAVALARGGRCGDAVDALSAFLVRWPDHPWADHAMYWRAGCMLSSGDARHAASELEALVTRFPSGEKVPDALYTLVGCYRRLGDTARARTTAARLLRDYPRSPSAERLRAETPTEPTARTAMETQR